MATIDLTGHPCSSDDLKYFFDIDIMDIWTSDGFGGGLFIPSKSLTYEESYRNEYYYLIYRNSDRGLYIRLYILPSRIPIVMSYFIVYDSDVVHTVRFSYPVSTPTGIEMREMRYAVLPCYSEANRIYQQLIDVLMRSHDE